MTQNELNKIIEKHQHYLNKDIDGWETMKADLSYKNLSGLDLSNANLRNADLRNANLYKANLINADLAYTDLRNANLRKADLRNADLRNADLSCANLRKADLADADLSNAYLRETDLCRAFCCYVNLYKANLNNANLREANLYGANLSYVDLRDADLRKADLRDADLNNADLRDADLSNADLSGAYISEDTKIDYPIACPETGSFIGYKKASYGYIVKLQICKNARRSSATTKKCRCSKALVLSIENRNGSYSGLQEIESIYNTSFVYRVGEIAEVPNFDDNRWYECAPGIHFFMDRQDAVEYEF